MKPEESKESEVIEMEPKETGVIKFSVTDAHIAKLRKKYIKVPTDLYDKKNYAIVKGAVSEIKPLRGKVEKRRKELKADVLERGRMIDSAAKEITGQLLEIEAPFVAAKKKHDTAVEIAKREKALAEEKRIDGIVDRITAVKDLVVNNVSSSSTFIKTAIDDLEEILPCNEWAMEFSDQAESAITDSLEKLNELHTMKLQQETQAEEAAKAEVKRKEEEEKARIKREEEAKAEREKIAQERADLKKKEDALVAQTKLAEKKEADAKAVADADKKKLLDEIAALKKQNEEKDVQEVAEVESSTQQNLPGLEPEPAPKSFPEKTLAKTPPTSTEKQAAGRAMKEIIGDFQTTKKLLEAIINGDIPNITFTGEV